MSTTTIGSIRPRAFRASGARVLGVVGAALAAAAVWAIAVPLLGLQLLVRFGNGAPQGVGLDAVLISSLVGSVAGWCVLALLERLTVRARAIWTGVAVAVVVASLTLPLVAGTTMSTKAVLALMHVAVGAVLITAMRRGSAD